MIASGRLWITLNNTVYTNATAIHMFPKHINIVIIIFLYTLECTIVLLRNVYYKQKTMHYIIVFVPEAGIEPAREYSQGILSPSCLPFHHPGIVELRHIVAELT